MEDKFLNLSKEQRDKIEEVKKIVVKRIETEYAAACILKPGLTYAEWLQEKVESMSEIRAIVDKIKR